MEKKDAGREEGNRRHETRKERKKTLKSKKAGDKVQGGNEEVE